MNCPDYFCQEHRECLCAENGLPEFAESTIVMFDTEEARGRMNMDAIDLFASYPNPLGVVTVSAEEWASGGVTVDDSKGSNS